MSAQRGPRRLRRNIRAVRDSLHSTPLRCRPLILRHTVSRWDSERLMIGHLPCWVAGFSCQQQGRCHPQRQIIGCQLLILRGRETVT